jgi:hypothetical protein
VTEPYQDPSKKKRHDEESHGPKDKGRKKVSYPQKYSKNNEQWRCQEQTLGYCNIATDKEL